MSTGAAFDEGVRDLVRESLRWRLAGLLLRRPRSGWHEETAALAREADHPALALAVAAAGGATEGVYLALVGPGGALSPREVSYRPIEDPGRLLAEIAAFHEAFGYRASPEDPRDHVAVAADFAGYLALKEAYARRTGREDDAETTCEARRQFIARHVRVTAHGMLRRLATIETAAAHVPAALSVLRALAGAQGGGDAEEPLSDEAFFPKPGLDQDVFDCECG